MENTNTQNIKKQDKILQEIDQLEQQISEVKDKIHTLDNEEKQEIYKSNLLEVKKDNLKTSITFYEKYSEEVNMKSAEKQKMYLNYSMTNEYYDKLLEIYRDKHLRQESSCSIEETSLLEENLYFQKHMDNLNKQNEELRSAIQINSATIKNLFEDIHLSQ